MSVSNCSNSVEESAAFCGREEIDYEVDEFIGLKPYQNKPEADNDESEELMNILNSVRKLSQDAWMFMYCKLLTTNINSIIQMNMPKSPSMSKHSYVACILFIGIHCINYSKTTQ